MKKEEKSLYYIIGYVQECIRQALREVTNGRTGVAIEALEDALKKIEGKS